MAVRLADMRPAAVWGRDDLVCPVLEVVVRRMIRHAFKHPWPGDRRLTCPAHKLDTTAILERGQNTRILLSVDYDYHGSGWFANSDYERCLHLSLSHPRPEIPRVYHRDLDGKPGRHMGMDLETPTDDEARAWGRVFFRQHATKAWFEPAVGPNDPYRSPSVVHLRLYLDKRGQPMIPRGEVYHLRPFADGSSPLKITEGRLGGDVR